MSSFLHSLIRLSIIAILTGSILACQTTRPKIHPTEIVFPLAALNRDPGMRDTAFQKIMNGQKTIIKIDKDYIFPLIFDLKNKAADVDINNNTIELSFKQDMYLSLSKKKTKLSNDGRNWYDITDLKALKKLLAYNRGTLRFSLFSNSGNSVAVIMTIATDAN